MKHVVGERNRNLTRAGVIVGFAAALADVMPAPAVIFYWLS